MGRRYASAICPGFCVADARCIHVPQTIVDKAGGRLLVSLRCGMNISRVNDSDFAYSRAYRAAKAILSGLDASEAQAIQYMTLWPTTHSLDHPDTTFPCPRCFLASVPRPLWIFAHSDTDISFSCRFCGLMFSAQV